MGPVSPIPALAALLVAFATGAVITWREGAPPAQGRYSTIDGLRGYLALVVFIYHGCIWYFHLRTGEWQLPSSRFYAHLGSDGVALFFMITGFLFFAKLIDGRTKPIDFGRLLVSRVLRLTPLYLFAVGLLLAIVAWLTSGSLHEPAARVAGQTLSWLAFTLPGSPDINGLPLTYRIVAGVTWSLPYEWFFYLALPLLALLVGVRAPVPYLLLSAGSLTGLWLWQPDPKYLLPFLGGMAAAGLVRWPAFLAFARGTGASLLVLALAGLALTQFPAGWTPAPLALLAAAFALIAGGNSLFGLLTHPASRTLGEMAYSIYLLHGLVLFTMFTFVIGRDEARQFSALAHWACAIAATPVVILVSHVTYRGIERPAMRATDRVVGWLRSRVRPAG